MSGIVDIAWVYITNFVVHVFVFGFCKLMTRKFFVKKSWDSHKIINFVGMTKYDGYGSTEISHRDRIF